MRTQPYKAKTLRGMQYLYPCAESGAIFFTLLMVPLLANKQILIYCRKYNLNS